MSFSHTLDQGACLIQSSEEMDRPSDLSSLLRARLDRYYASKNQTCPVPPSASQDDIQLATASEALVVIQQAHDVLASEKDSMIGSQNMSQVKTLLSLVFRWGTTALLNRVSHSWPSKASSTHRSVVIDLTDAPTQYHTLVQLTKRIIGLLFPEGVHGPIVHTYITSVMLSDHLSNILSSCITLGWLPKSLSNPAIPTVDELRPPIMRLLAKYALGVPLCVSPDNNKRVCSVSHLLKPSKLWVMSSHQHLPCQLMSANLVPRY